MKVGDLVRYDPGPDWTDQEKKDNCAIGLVIEVSYPDTPVSYTHLTLPTILRV